MTQKKSESVTELVRRKRDILGLDHAGFAKFIGMRDGERSVTSVRDWEEGRAEPTKSKLVQIKRIPDSPPFKSTHDGKFKFIDLFAGIGGVRLPFQIRGGRCVFTSEWDKFSQRTYANNFGEVPHGDITKITASEIPNHDVLLAGFPCQAFSQAGLRKGFADTRGTLFFEIQRILTHHQPKAFLLENVKQLRGHDGGRTLATILSILRGDTSAYVPDTIKLSEEARHSLSKRLHYDVDFRVFSSKDFGVPQNRERIYIVGFNMEKLSNYEAGQAKEMLNELATRTSKTSLGDILEENSKLDSSFTISDRLWSGHQRRLLEHRERGNGFGYSLFNKKSPYCNTISARYYKDGSEILIDQSDIGKNPRKLTPRECARIQGFPEEYFIEAVSNPQMYKQFGNSVSVPVIDAIAEKMIKILSHG